ncbi:E3 ubiquitin-protein ligase sh3rf2 [Blyttiomyces sp. JEL0837]|nr:E3 ubiquitin-protein ligase sh3rf2 [Blyttiomyces sp. JEL0837]
MANNLPNECASIANTRSCAPWNDGLYINLTAVSKFYSINNPNHQLTVAEWDYAVHSSSKGGDVSATAWRDFYGCSGYNGEPIQFQLTFNCLTDIWALSAGCNTAAAAANADMFGNANMRRQQRRGLVLNLQQQSANNIVGPCANACDHFESATRGLLSDESACPVANMNVETEQRRDGIQNAGQLCRDVVSFYDGIYGDSKGNCVNAVNDDLSFCGFAGNLEAASTYCMDEKNEPYCCLSVQRQQNRLNFISNSNSNNNNDIFTSNVENAPPQSLFHDLLFGKKNGVQDIFLQQQRNDAPVTVPTDNTDNTSSSSSGHSSLAIALGVSVGATFLIASVAFAVYVLRNKNSIGKTTAPRVVKGGKRGVGGGYSLADDGTSTSESSLLSVSNTQTQRRYSRGSASQVPNLDAYVVVHNYDAHLKDEIDLRPGQQVEVLQIYDDGWAKGRNIVTGLTGTFPMAVIKIATGDSSQAS